MSRTRHHRKPKTFYVHKGKNPKWWDVLMHTRPHRRQTAKCLCWLKQGADPEEMVWPEHHKPTEYYW